MLTFAGIVPHSPLLIPSVGKDQKKHLDATTKAMEAMEQALYLTNPETIVIISPHGPLLADAFTINLSANYKLSLKEFGDFQPPQSIASDFMLIDKIQRNARKEIPLSLISEEVVDYGVSVPIVLLTAHLAKVSLVPVLVSSGLDLKAHYDFGKELKDEIMKSNKRVAVFASADLSHTLTQDAPGGFAKEGEELDKLVQTLLSNKNAAGLISIDQGLCQSAKECGLRPIVTLLGILDGVKYDPKLLAYEGPFGVGYLTANLALT